MFRNAILGLAMLLGIGAGLAPAQPSIRPRPQPTMSRFERLATEWTQLYLRRNPTQRELLMMVNQLRSGASANEVQATILSSPEYIRRSGNALYTWANSMVADVLGRPITPA